MTLQQLQYIVAVDTYRHFVKAAESCNVTQATLSQLIRNLEEELDVVIFDRSTHPVSTTETGRKVIDQAKIILLNTKVLREIASSEKDFIPSELRLGLISTLAPVLLPSLYQTLYSMAPSMSLHTYEMRISTLIDHLVKGEVDMGIAPSPTKNADILEVPLYEEKFFAYISKDMPLYGKKELSMYDLKDLHRIWTLHDGLKMYPSVEELQLDNESYAMMFEGGRVSILLEIIDRLGGMTVIPELFATLLPPDSRDNIRPIRGSVPTRVVSLLIRRDYVHEKLLNLVVEAITKIIPPSMLRPEVRSLPVRL